MRPSEIKWNGGEGLDHLAIYLVEPIRAMAGKIIEDGGHFPPDGFISQIETNAEEIRACINRFLEEIIN